MDEALRVFVLGFGSAVDQFVVLVYGQNAVGREAFDGEGAGDSDVAFVVVGFVAEAFGVGFGGDGGVDFFLAGDAVAPPFGVELVSLVGHLASLRGVFATLPTLV